MQNALFIVHYTKGEKVIIKDCGRYKYLFDSIKGPVDYVVIHVPDVLITAHNLLSSALKSSAIFNNKQGYFYVLNAVVNVEVRLGFLVSLIPTPNCSLSITLQRFFPVDPFD